MINIDENLIKDMLPKRKKDSNKGDFGKVLCITGSKNYTGAGMLSAISALKTGAGYSILCSDEFTINLLRKSSYDIIFKSHGDFNFDTVKDYIESQKIDSIVFGCGIGLNSATIEFTNKIIEYLKNKNIPVVIDADGLNCLAENSTILNSNFILTPHPKELSKLLKMDVQSIQENRCASATKAQEKFNAHIVLKGYETIVCTKDSMYKNGAGNSALSKAGTGDVLAGMIGGFLSQKVTPTNASVLSVYLHGLAAEIYSQEFSEYSMLASDLFTYVPKAINRILAQ